MTAFGSDDAIRKFSETLDAKGLGIIDVNVEVLDDHEVVAMNAVIGWFVRRHNHS
jgi:hypothetical protein